MVRLPWFVDSAVWVKATLTDEDSLELVCTSVRQSKGEFQSNGPEEYNDLQSLAQKWSGAPIVLHLTGRGCITKKMAKESDEIIGEEIIRRMLPNANEKEFSVQVFDPGKTEDIHVSIIRTSVLDQITGQFLHCGLPIKQIILGQFEAISETTSPYPLKFKKDIANEGNKAWTHQMLALERSTSLGISTVSSPMLLKHQKELRNFNRTKKLVIIGPALLLCALILNMLWYDHLEQRYVEAESKIEARRSELDSIALLESMMSEQVKVLGSARGFSSIPASYYSDRLGKSITRGITLNKLDIFPMIHNPETGQVQKLKYDTILVSGISQNSSALNNWVTAIDKLQWIKGVNILDYSQTSTDDDGHFELLITCN